MSVASLAADVEIWLTSENFSKRLAEEVVVVDNQNAFRVREWLRMELKRRLGRRAAQLTPFLAQLGMQARPVIAILTTIKNAERPPKLSDPEERGKPGSTRD
jgi:hypothetical protein